MYSFIREMASSKLSILCSTSIAAEGYSGSLSVDCGVIGLLFLCGVGTVVLDNA